MPLPFASLDDLPPPPGPKFTPLDELPDPGDDFVAKRPVSFFERPIASLAQGVGQMLADEPAGLQVSPQTVDARANQLGTRRDVYARYLQTQGMRPDVGGDVANDAQLAALPGMPTDPLVLAELFRSADIEARQAPARAQEEELLSRVTPVLRPAFAAGRGAGRLVQQSILAAGALAGGGDDTRAVLEDVGQQAQAEQQGRDLTQGPVGRILDRAGSNVLAMAAVPGGAGAKITQGALSTYAQSYQQAKDAGLDDEAARQFAAKQASVEGVIAGAANAAGAGGVESMLSGGTGAGGAVRQIVGGTLRQELPEELATTALQQGISTDIDPNATSGQTMAQALGDTALQTVAMGGMSSPVVIAANAGRARAEKAQRIADERARILAELDATLPGEGQDPTERMRAPLAGGMNPATAAALAQPDTRPRIPQDDPAYPTPEATTYDGTPITVSMDPVAMDGAGDTLAADGETVGDFPDQGQTQDTLPDANSQAAVERVRSFPRRMSEAQARLADLQQQEQGQPEGFDPAAATRTDLPAVQAQDEDQTMATEGTPDGMGPVRDLARQMRTPQERAAAEAEQRRQNLPDAAAISGEQQRIQQAQDEADLELQARTQDSPEELARLEAEIPVAEERLKALRGELAGLGRNDANSQELRAQRLAKHNAELQGGIRLTDGGDGVENQDGTVRSFDKALAASPDYRAELETRQRLDRQNDRRDNRTRINKRRQLAKERQQLADSIRDMKAQADYLRKTSKRGERIDKARAKAPVVPPADTTMQDAGVRNEARKAEIANDTPDRKPQERAQAIARLMLRESRPLQTLDRVAPQGDPDRDAALAEFKRLQPAKPVPQAELPTTQQALASEEEDGARQVEPADESPDLSGPNMVQFLRKYRQSGGKAKVRAVSMVSSDEIAQIVGSPASVAWDPLLGQLLVAPGASGDKAARLDTSKPLDLSGVTIEVDGSQESASDVVDHLASRMSSLRRLRLCLA